ncbi:MAG: Clp protease N-terminal domain-containing protein, partial [Hyphomicrobium sp.]
MIVDDLGRIPMSQHLAATLARAASYADAQQHPEVTLEHLLLALAEDTDAAGVLRSSNVDLARLAGEVSTHIGQIDARRDPNGPAQVLISHDLKRILEAAAAAARQGRRAEINGAIVLAAIVGDGKSTAAHLLRVQGLTFEQAIRALQRAAAAPPRPDPSPQPSPHGPPGAQQGSTEDILANARERVQSRSVQGQPNQGPAVQQGPPSVAPPAPMPPSPFQQPAPPYGEPPSPPRPEFRPEIRPEIRPDPQQRDPAQSP